MSFQPYNRNAKSLVYFGDAGADAVFQSDSDLKFDDSTNKLIIPSNGYIGSVGDDDAIQISAAGDVTFSQDIVVQGDFTVNGDTITVNTTNLAVTDSLIELSQGATSAINDAGFIIERGSTGDNAAFIWDESADRFTLGTTTSTGSSTGDLSVTVGTLAANIVGDVTGDLTGNADTATALETGRNFSLTGDVTASAVSFDGTSNVTLSASLAASAIDDLSDLGGAPDATNDFIMIYDASAEALKKVNRTNFVSGLGAMSSFTVTADSGSDQQVDDGETLDIAGGTGISTVVGATNTVTVSISSGGVGTTQLAADAVTGAKIADDAVNSEHLVDGSVDNVHLAGGITFAKLDGGAYLTSAEAFSDSNTQLMTAAAIDDRILSYGYSTTTGTVTSVGGTGSINGITLSGTVTSTGNITLGGALSNVTLSQLAASSVITSAESFSDDDDTLMTSAAIDDRILSYGYSTTTGTVTSVGGTGSVNGLTLSGTVTSSGSLTLGGTLSGVAVSNMAASAIQTGAEVGASGGTIGDNDTSLLTAAAVINFVEGKGYSTTAGTVTSITAGTGLSGGTITDSGTIAIDAGGVDTTQLAADAVTGAKIADDAVNSEHIAAGAVDLEHMSANSVDSDQYVDGSIDTAHIGNLQVTTAKLAGDAVDGSKLADDAVNSEHIANGAIDLVHMSANSVDSDQYVDGSIDAAHIASSAVTEVKRLRSVGTASSTSTISSDITLGTSGAGGITLTLPTAVSGKVVIVKKVDSGVGALTISGPTNGIDGATTKALYHQYETMTFVSNGSVWYVI